MNSMSSTVAVKAFLFSTEIFMEIGDRIPF